mmetsp:Transcript_14918/g.33861  ORF Transcript_14918/g.33861 Transcript_14918/m.33861 type:complete len:325 (-) Transcript_14918:2149-3123(-)
MFRGLQVECLLGIVRRNGRPFAERGVGDGVHIEWVLIRGQRFVKGQGLDQRRREGKFLIVVILPVHTQHNRVGLPQFRLVGHAIRWIEGMILFQKVVRILPKFVPFGLVFVIALVVQILRFDPLVHAGNAIQFDALFVRDAKGGVLERIGVGGCVVIVIIGCPGAQRSHKVLQGIKGIATIARARKFVHLLKRRFVIHFDADGRTFVMRQEADTGQAQRQTDEGKFARLSHPARGAGLVARWFFFDNVDRCRRADDDGTTIVCQDERFFERSQRGFFRRQGIFAAVAATVTTIARKGNIFGGRKQAGSAAVAPLIGVFHHHHHH